LKFGAPLNGKCWYIFDHLESFTAISYVLQMAIWYRLWSFGIFFPFWYVWIKKNLATLFAAQLISFSHPTSETQTQLAEKCRVSKSPNIYFTKDRFENIFDWSLSAISREKE
jgi:hypothetical protein